MSKYLKCKQKLTMIKIIVPNRKVEDLQFRVEEACITKGDLEVFEVVCSDITFRPTAVVTLDFDPFTEFK